MTDQERWRYYVHLYAIFRSGEPSEYVGSRTASYAESAGKFADAMMAEEDKRFAVVRGTNSFGIAGIPDLSPPKRTADGDPVPPHSMGGPYR